MSPNLKTYKPLMKKYSTTVWSCVALEFGWWNCQNNPLCILGVHLDLALTMETQVASVVRSTHLHLRQIAQLRPCLDAGSFTTLIVSRIDYCNALYVGRPLRLMRKLQMVQNKVARLLTGVKRFHHIPPHFGCLTLATYPLLHWFQDTNHYI